MKMHWVVVADASRAHVLAADELLQEFEAVAELIHPESMLRAKDQVSDDRGRTRGGPGSHWAPQSAFDAHTNLKSHEVESFAREVAKVLRNGLLDKEYERLVLVAAPSLLGNLRAALDKEVEKAIVGEIPLNLTKLPIHELPAAVRGRLSETAGLP